MAQDEGRAHELEETVVNIRRCSAVVKGGRRFSYNALVVLGDRGGRVGFGYGKANEVPPAVEKAVKDARKSLRRISLSGHTIPHEVVGRYGSARVMLRPARPGTGVIAGASVRAVVEAVGIRDVLTKRLGSGNPLNLVKATVNALESLRSKQEVERLRGVKL